MTTTQARPRLVRCRLGGYAPCVDDLCHGVDTTVCGLEHGFDFCDHGYDPDACSECAAEDDYSNQGDWTAADAAGHPYGGAA
jgi:hypothetical protein